MHPMRRDMRQHRPARKLIRLPLAHSRNCPIQRMLLRRRRHIRRRLIQHFQQLICRPLLPLWPGPLLAPSEHIAPDLHRSEHMRHRVMQRPRPHLKSLVELLRRQLRARLNNQLRRPSIVSQQNFNWIACCHARNISIHPHCSILVGSAGACLANYPVLLRLKFCFSCLDSN
jgi:hypothetical protein